VRSGLRALVLLAVALALPALGYLPPATALLKRVVQKRDDLGLTSIEVDGTLDLEGDAALAAGSVLAPPAGSVAPAASGPNLSLPATVLLKAPGRCRLELVPEGVPPAARPALSFRGARVSSQKGLDGLPAVRALLGGLCTLLAERGAGGAEPERYLAERLATEGVSLTDVSFGRLDGRIAWVLGGRSPDSHAQAWIDKLTFEPVRFVAPVAGVTRDVRLIDYGSPIGGVIFPRAVEVWSSEKLEARFTPSKVTTNQKLPDALF
jgi:hypothetical protein